MRIVGGVHRGRVLTSPVGKDIRPTLDRVRESLFNILNHAGRWYDTGRNPVYDGLVLDAFAGSGALGIEALSRGATHAVFFERDEAALATISRNIADLKLGDQAKARRADATKPPHASQPASLVFLDPPYGQDLLSPTIAALKAAGWINAETLIVAERDQRDTAPTLPGLEILDSRKYGRCQIEMMRFYDTV
ncbi:16S rRNA (guanine(966)-N(2))-methyltransferase RsmD [Thalassospira sp.]|uniref:16S rRNA (guanine(966)-N(2))-methyltransferase RsmD n=1 Tax=Thalassospira sp. TaxID=1912094 RepID=UPI0027376111|nr:16S rRNA (guanine(966)-N(2))-methyltransferase RsmD [Thalassospira sp.]MDP2699621.1 16S rRNA (guanine(966)-N(2))-methyltransferase RsmD [Thalassospira sp.]